jgi:hypothetical protein
MYHFFPNLPQSTEDDPYHMTLHKLWTKMCEKDWRTVVKSLYVLHSISRDCSTDACQRFATAIKYGQFIFVSLFNIVWFHFQFLVRLNAEQEATITDWTECHPELNMLLNSGP